MIQVPSFSIGAVAGSTSEAPSSHGPVFTEKMMLVGVLERALAQDSPGPVDRWPPQKATTVGKSLLSRDFCNSLASSPNT